MSVQASLPTDWRTPPTLGELMATAWRAFERGWTAAVVLLAIEAGSAVATFMLAAVFAVVSVGLGVQRFEHWAAQLPLAGIDAVRMGAALVCLGLAAVLALLAAGWLRLSVWAAVAGALRHERPFALERWHLALWQAGEHLWGYLLFSMVLSSVPVFLVLAGFFGPLTAVPFIAAAPAGPSTGEILQLVGAATGMVNGLAAAMFAAMTLGAAATLVFAAGFSEGLPLPAALDRAVAMLRRHAGICVQVALTLFIMGSVVFAAESLLNGLLDEVPWAEKRLAWLATTVATAMTLVFTLVRGLLQVFSMALLMAAVRSRREGSVPAAVAWPAPRAEAPLEAPGSAAA